MVILDRDGVIIEPCSEHTGAEERDQNVIAGGQQMQEGTILDRVVFAALDKLLHDTSIA